MSIAKAPLPALVINLARSTDRWERISASVPGSGLVLQRIEAIEGKAVARENRTDLATSRFQRWHGRTVLDGEYGCYRSHISALRSVVDQGLPLAIIAEDDIAFTPRLGERVSAMFAAKPGIHVLKLVNHRTNGFISHGVSPLGDTFGRCIHGPQGSAACYAVTTHGAKRLLKTLHSMWLPYDIALERGWYTGASTYTTRLPMVFFDRHQAETTIATREEYRASKLPKIRQIGTASFRGYEYLRRMLYTVTGGWADYPIW